jgi:hypothetical protein
MMIRRPLIGMAVITSKNNAGNTHQNNGQDKASHTAPRMPMIKK